MRVLLPLVFVMLAAAASAAVPPPRLVAQHAALTLALPRELLDDAEIRKELRSGLTTTFVVTVRNGSHGGGARVELRYELWDEVYLVRTFAADGHQQQASFPSAAALAEWWRTAPITVAAAPIDGLWRVELEVLPFSATEEADAKRWLAESAASAAERTQPPTAAGASSSPLLDAVIGTSVRRKPLLRYVWQLRASSDPSR